MSLFFRNLMNNRVANRKCKTKDCSGKVVFGLTKFVCACGETVTMTKEFIKEYRKKWKI